MNEQSQQELDTLRGGILGFWTQKMKVSILILILLILLGLYALYKIPKEASPDVNAGIITVITTYPGVSPEDIDSLITDKIETKIEGIEGINSYDSTSSQGVSSIQVTLDTDVVIRDVLADIKDTVDTVDLPADANDPVISEVDVTNKDIFSVYLYADEDTTSKFDLVQKAQFLKEKLQDSSYLIGNITISPKGAYEIQVLIDKKKIERLGLSLQQIAGIIQSYNKNTPLGNYTIDKLNYDFRFDGELTSATQLENIIISSQGSSFLMLKDIAIIKKKYTDTSITTVGFPHDFGYTAVNITIEKANGTSIFAASKKAKENLASIISSQQRLSGLRYIVYQDRSKNIIEDYKNLASSSLQTLGIVFVVILFFISFKEALITVFILPLSFFITFLVLNATGFSMNFLTNFSLILSLTVAIDTIIVVVEGSSEKQKLGYDKKTAVLMAVNEFKAPLIAGSLTTLAVFLPLMTLPGMMGKFLSYIPVTVFVTLLASLIIALTLSSTIYVLFAKDRKYYFTEPKIEKNLQPFQREILEQQRSGKKEGQHEKLSLKERVLTRMGNIYYSYLESVLHTKLLRILIIVAPFVLMVISMMTLAPAVGFTMIPATDEGRTTITLEAQEGATEISLDENAHLIDKILSTVRDLKLYSTTISGNKITLYIEAIDEQERERSIFTIQKEILEKLKLLQSEGYKVSSQAASMGPPNTGGAVGVKLIATNTEYLDTLKKVAADFLDFTYTLEGAKNHHTSSTETPGQFVFTFDEEKLVQLGLTPNDILTEVYFYINGVKASSIASDFEDNDIVLKISDFEDHLSPDDVLNLIVPTKSGKIRVGDVARYTFTKAVSSINREDGKITITVGLDPDEGYLTSDIQPKLSAFAENYEYPTGVSFSQGGENEENAELLTAMLVSFGVAIFLMFFILVTQFDSYGQPVIILISVVLSLLGVNIGLFVTGHPYSLPAIIGFIALAGVVVNDSIVLIDRINRNLKKGLEEAYAVAAAGRSRLQPILVTTITTSLGVFPLTLQGAFWAGLAYVIMFGIFVGSMLTIFCTPLMYYTFFLGKGKKTEQQE